MEYKRPKMRATSNPYTQFHPGKLTWTLNKDKHLIPPYLIRMWWQDIEHQEFSFEQFALKPIDLRYFRSNLKVDMARS